VAGRVTPQSYSWDFKGEANSIFKDIQYEAMQAVYHADVLQSFKENTTLDWETHARQLDFLKQEINEIGAKLCRLETIRRVLDPWQQHVVDRVAVSEREMAGTAQNAILFVNEKPGQLWQVTYRDDLVNLYNQADSLTHTVNNATEFAGVSKTYHDLGHKLGMKSPS